MRFYMSVGILMMLACVWAQAAETGQAYAIKFDRGYAVGQKFHMAVTGTNQSKGAMTVEGEKPQEEYDQKFSMKLEGTVHILQVNAQRNPVKFSLTIDRCVKIDGEKEVSLADKGTVVLINLEDNEAPFTINDQPAEGELSMALTFAFFLSHEKMATPSENEIYGTKILQHVGDSWNLDITKAIHGLDFFQMGIKPEDIRGQATLRDVKTVDGQPCLDIAVTMQAKDFTPQDFPADGKVTKSNVTYTYSGLFPVDPAQPVVEEQQELAIEFAAKAKPEPDAKTEMSVNTKQSLTVTTQYSPVK